MVVIGIVEMEGAKMAENTLTLVVCFDAITETTCSYADGSTYTEWP